MPDGCVLLVDTYDTKAGIEQAIKTAKELRAARARTQRHPPRLGRPRGAEPSRAGGVCQSGLPGIAIVASDDLDEHRIAELRARGAEIDVYGVGTRLVTGGDQAALGVVYKLSAVTEGSGQPWRPVMKLSSNPAKRSLPGDVLVQRYLADGRLVGDGIALGPGDESPLEGERQELLSPVIRSGSLVHPGADRPRGCGACVPGANSVSCRSRHAR